MRHAAASAWHRRTDEVTWIQAQGNRAGCPRGGDNVIDLEADEIDVEVLNSRASHR